MPTCDGNLTFDGNFTSCYDAENRLIASISGGTCASPTTTVASFVFICRQARTLPQVEPRFAPVQIAAAEAIEEGSKVLPDDGQARSVATAGMARIDA